MEEPIDLKAKSLEEILTYENENVIYRFMNHFNVKKEEALEIFTETKKWLWLLSVSKKMAKKSEIEIPTLFISQELYIIDEMWHTFILFTIDYRAFCTEYLGLFIDHSPVTVAEVEANKKRYRENPEAALEDRRLETKTQYSFVYDHLGEEVLLKWYDELPERYSLEKIKSLKKK